MTSQDIQAIIKQQNLSVISKMLKDLIAEHADTKTKTLGFYERYRGDSAPILSRNFEDKSKVNNQLVNDYPGIIIDQITGYVWGRPIVTEIEDEKAQNEFRSFSNRNNLSDLDFMTGELSVICGYSARLCYIDREGKERVMSLNPWEVIFIEDRTLSQMQYGVVYYDQTVNEGDKTFSQVRVELYDSKEVFFFVSDREGDFHYDDTEPVNPLPHGFDYVPVIKFQNNNTEQSDFQKVESLINDYDVTLSNNSNEIGEVNQAFLTFLGIDGFDEEELQKIKLSRTISLPEGTDAKFLIKSINPEFIEFHKKTLNENIYKFSGTVDMSAENFSGSGATGEARKWLLVPLENKAIKKENKFTNSLKQQYRVIASAWAKRGIHLSIEDMKFTFTRNLPVDYLYSAEIQDKLMGKVSDETRLSLAPFITDVESELEKLNQEREAYQNALSDSGAGESSSNMMSLIS